MGPSIASRLANAQTRWAMPTSHFHETRILDAETDWAVHVLSFPAGALPLIRPSSNPKGIRNILADVGLTAVSDLETGDQVRAILAGTFSAQATPDSALTSGAPLPDAVRFVNEVLETEVPVEQSPLDGIRLKDLLPPATVAVLLTQGAHPLVALGTAGAVLLVIPAMGIASGAARALAGC